MTLCHKRFAEIILSVSSAAIMAVYLFHLSGKLSSFSLYGTKNRNLGEWRQHLASSIYYNTKKTPLLDVHALTLILRDVRLIFTALKNIYSRSSLTLYSSVSLAWRLFVMDLISCIRESQR